MALRSLGLIISFAIMFQPAARMAAAGIMMGPMHYASLGIPFIFTTELHDITPPQGCNFRGNIYIVDNQQGFS